MGCILGVLTFIWKVIKFVFNAILKAVEIVVNVFIDIGLAIPFVGAVTILCLWLFGVIEKGTDLFLACWIGLGALTVLNILINLRRRKRRKQREREKAEAIKRYEQELKEKEHDERKSKRRWFK